MNSNNNLYKKWEILKVQRKDHHILIKLEKDLHINKIYYQVLIKKSIFFNYKALQKLYLLMNNSLNMNKDNNNLLLKDY